MLFNICHSDTAEQYKAAFTAIWTSPHEGSLLSISKIFEVDSAKSNKIKS